MSVDLLKHKEELLSAWGEVVDDKSDTNWALFGYEKQANSLRVIEKGAGGLEELIEELNSAKIMYAFCRVTDPNTSLIKYVLVNWQGEGAPLARKGCCANHVHEISNFFKGICVTINARTEDDMEPAMVMEKVAKSTGSKFNFKDRSDPSDHTTPVGSVYKRIQPAAEINTKERAKFWMKEQEEEKRRQEEERKKSQSQKAKIEQECRERELKSMAQRDEKVKERTKSITEVREAEHNAENTARNVKFEKMQWEKQLKEDASDEKERRTRSESLRRERSQEAQALISQRTFNARAIFEANTCAGQMSSIQNNNSTPQSSILQESPIQKVAESVPQQEWRPNKVAPASYTPEPEKIVNRIPETRQENMRLTLNEDLDDNQDQGYDVPSPAPPERPLPGSGASNGSKNDSYQAEKNPSYNSQFSYTRNLLKEGLPIRQDTSEIDNEEEEQNWDEPTLEAPPDVRDPLVDLLAEQGITPPTSSQGSEQPSPQIIRASPSAQMNGGGLRARALYDYQAADETEISFDPDDLITHIEQIDEGWWQGMGPDGTYGLFPANYVELID